MSMKMDPRLDQAHGGERLEGLRAPPLAAGLDEAAELRAELELARNLNRALAHELNNLLTGVGGCAKAALGKLDEHAPAHPFVAEIRATCQRSSRMSRRALALLRALANAPETNELDHVLESAEAPIRETLGPGRALRFQLGAGRARVGLCATAIDALVAAMVLSAHDASRDGHPLVVVTSSPRPSQVVVSVVEDDANAPGGLVLEGVVAAQLGGLEMAVLGAVLARAGGRLEREAISSLRVGLRVTLPRLTA